MESHPGSHYTATPLNSAYASGGSLPAPWVRPAVAFSNNTQSGQFELYRSGTLSGVVKCPMHGSELWLLDAETLYPAHPQLLNELSREVMDEAIKRHVAVMPFSTATRHLMRKHRAYLSLVPEPARGQFLIPPPPRPVPVEGIAGTT